VVEENDSTGSSRNSAFEAEREQLRAMLAFPESIESAPSPERRNEPRPRAAPPPQPVPPEAIAPVIDHAPSDDVSRRLDQLAIRVAALVGLVESVFDRLERSETTATAPLTADELADVAARMVRLIETRLETHTERLGQVIAELSTRGAAIAAAEGGANLALLDDHLSAIGRAVLDVQKSMAHLDQSPSEVQELAIMAHVDRWFEETNSRMATDVEHVRRDLHRFDEALASVQATIASSPASPADNEDLVALRRAVAELPARVAQLLAETEARRPPVVIEAPETEGLSDLQRTIAELPERVALQQPVARLDAAILQQLDARLEEMTTQLMQKTEDLLASRVQRFEALSQAMMTLVGEPIDSLTDKLNELAKEREVSRNTDKRIRSVEEKLDKLSQGQGSIF
jgi:hypothetical protein